MATLWTLPGRNFRILFRSLLPLDHLRCFPQKLLVIPIILNQIGQHVTVEDYRGHYREIGASEEVHPRNERADDEDVAQQSLVGPQVVALENRALVEKDDFGIRETSPRCRPVATVDA